MARDPLKNVVGNVNKQIKSDAPFQKSKEKTKSVQVRQHVYVDLKRLAMLRKTTMVDIVNKLLVGYLSKQKDLRKYDHYMSKLKNN